jgi:N-acetylglutamate synthase-like GNAT family acetyltransferase
MADGTPPMIRACDDRDFDAIWEIINDGAQAYKGIIPADRWTEPYMSREKLQHEIDDRVAFSGYEMDGRLAGVMGIQPVQDVTLIRHAYVRTSSRNRGIGSKLLAHLRETTDRPVLIGTWADATWAIAFYEKHGFHLVQPDEKNRVVEEVLERARSPGRDVSRSRRRAMAATQRIALRACGQG